VRRCCLQFLFPSLVDLTPEISFTRGELPSAVTLGRSPVESVRIIGPALVVIPVNAIGEPRCLFLNAFCFLLVTGGDIELAEVQLTGQTSVGGISLSLCPDTVPVCQVCSWYSVVFVRYVVFSFLYIRGFQRCLPVSGGSVLHRQDPRRRLPLPSMGVGSWWERSWSFLALGCPIIG